MQTTKGIHPPLPPPEQQCRPLITYSYLTYLALISTVFEYRSSSLLVLSAFIVDRISHLPCSFIFLFIFLLLTLLSAVCCTHKALRKVTLSFCYIVAIGTILVLFVWYQNTQHWTGRGHSEAGGSELTPVLVWYFFFFFNRELGSALTPCARRLLFIFAPNPLGAFRSATRFQRSPRYIDMRAVRELSKPQTAPSRIHADPAMTTGSFYLKKKTVLKRFDNCFQISVLYFLSLLFSFGSGISCVSAFLLTESLSQNPPTPTPLPPSPFLLPPSISTLDFSKFRGGGKSNEPQRLQQCVSTSTSISPYIFFLPELPFHSRPMCTLLIVQNFKQSKIPLAASVFQFKPRPACSPPPPPLIIFPSFPKQNPRMMKRFEKAEPTTTTAAAATAAAPPRASANRTPSPAVVPLAPMSLPPFEIAPSRPPSYASFIGLSISVPTTRGTEVKRRSYWCRNHFDVENILIYTILI